MPQVRFINIGGSGGKIYDTRSVPFSGEPRIVREIYGPHINPKRIIIVDEYTHTGQAIQDAEKVLREAFPEAKVFSIVAYPKLPNWYQNGYFLGVEEYSRYDYEKMALYELNRRRGTSFGSRSELNAELSWDLENL